MRKAALLLAAASLAALPGATAQARVFFGVGIGIAPPIYYAPPPVYYAPPPMYYAPPPYVAYPSPLPPPALVGASPAPGTMCVTARFSCPMSQAGVLGGSCSCPTAAGTQASGVIR